MRNKIILGMGAAFVMSVAGVATADYTLSPQVGGSDNVTVNPGDSFAVDLVLSSDASDFNTSAIFTVEFSKPGLQYTSYAWSDPYTTGGVDDNSQPHITELPTILTESSYVASFGDPGAVDAYFENFAGAGQFTTGTLLTMSMVVPAGFETGTFTITAVPDTFDNGTETVPTSGESMTVNVVPEPAAIGLLGLAAVSCLRRRRR